MSETPSAPLPLGETLLRPVPTAHFPQIEDLAKSTTPEAAEARRFRQSIETGDWGVQPFQVLQQYLYARMLTLADMRHYYPPEQQAAEKIAEGPEPENQLEPLLVETREAHDGNFWTKAAFCNRRATLYEQTSQEYQEANRSGLALTYGVAADNWRTMGTLCAQRAENLKQPPTPPPPQAS